MPNPSDLLSAWSLPDTLRQRLGDQAGRQRAMFAEGHLLIVLHAPPAEDSPARQGRFFWRSPEGAWRSTAQGDGENALRRHLAEFQAALQVLDDAEELASTAEEYIHVLRSLQPMVRATRHLHEALQESRQLCPEDRGLIGARDEAVTLERTAELLYGDAQNGLEFHTARQAEEQARLSQQMAVAGHRLNLLAATFFPIATFAAVFGMNLRHGFEQHPTWVFWAVFAAGLTLGLLVQRLIARDATPLVQDRGERRR